MSVLTLEGIVDHGQIPDVKIEQTVRIESPRLVHREQAADFTMEVSKADADV
jgi:hypothetical protein